jgi:FPC/CPF motif-containing protein YcgG
MLAADATDTLREDFLAFIAAERFQCVGAKSALARGAITVFEARDIRSGWDDLRIHTSLCDFGRSVAKDSTTLRSFAVIFEGPQTLSESEFERCLWERLQSLSDKDRWLSYKYDPVVDPDPASPEFAFSIGGTAYFVVGMHPRSSRHSRRTPMPALVFNPFCQFQRLRETGRYERMSDVVRARDSALCGSDNPMLAEHGAASAARQFCGRRVNESWVCPFAPRGQKAGAS